MYLEYILATYISFPMLPLLLLAGGNTQSILYNSHYITFAYVQQ